MTLSTTFQELLESFNSEGVRYLIVGGYAVIFHGYSRLTKDIDLWIEPTEDNATRVVAALEATNFYVNAVTKMKLQSPRQLIILGDAPNRVDLITGLKEFDFDEHYQQRKIEFVQGTELSVISLRGLRELKAAAGRLQDQVDLEKLPEI